MKLSLPVGETDKPMEVLHGTHNSRRTMGANLRPKPNKGSPNCRNIHRGSFTGGSFKVWRYNKPKDCLGRNYCLGGSLVLHLRPIPREVRVRPSRQFFKGIRVHAWLDRHSRLREELSFKGTEGSKLGEVSRGTHLSRLIQRSD